MSLIAISGATGYAGRFIVDSLLNEGHEIVAIGRHAPSASLFQSPVAFHEHHLGDVPETNIFVDCDIFIHAAFDHIPGKFRGGEGDDPEGFRCRNHEGSVVLFEAAKSAGVSRAVFLSSRAVYGAQEPGTTLYERTEPKPDTLYGQIKLETEIALTSLASQRFLPFIIRATGIYGASWGNRNHKWSALFDAFEKDECIEPRTGTEVHGEDLAQAVRLLLETSSSKLPPPNIYNVSDILLDRRTLLESYSKLRGINSNNLPKKAQAERYNVMDCDRLLSLGWKPRKQLDLRGL